MIRRRRATICMLAIASTVAVVIVLVATSDRSASPSEVQPRSTRLGSLAPRAATTQHPSAAAPRGTEPPNPTQGAGQRLFARRVAGRFLRAFLRYQAGHVDSAVRRALGETSTRELANTLLRRPPRLSRAGTAHARRGSLAAYGPFDGQLKVVVRLAYGHRRGRLLELALEQRGSGVRVAALYP